MNRRRLSLPAIACLVCLTLSAAQHQGQVSFDGVPVPGAVVTLQHGDRILSTVTDQQGNYWFSALVDGVWQLRVEMLCFAPVEQDISVAATMPMARWELELAKAPPPEPQHPAISVSLTQSPGVADNSGKASSSTRTRSTAKGFQVADVRPLRKAENLTDEEAADAELRAADGFLVNGSANNAASSFGQSAAFGNKRKKANLYSGAFGVIVDNSSLDAQSFSLTGQTNPKPAYNRMTLVGAFGGPLRWQRVFHDKPPNLVINYQFTRNRTATTQSSLVPSLAMRAGDFSQTAPIFDPMSGAMFPANAIPQSRISPAATKLLSLYPLPNFSGGRYNYQVPIVDALHQDSLQARVNKTLDRKDQLSGLLAYRNTRSDAPNLFGFLDTSNAAGINSTITWRRFFTPMISSSIGVQYSRLSTRTTPFFAGRENVSGAAGIVGNNQDPANWGPPTLTFDSGLLGLSDGRSSFLRSQTLGISPGFTWVRGTHHVTFGADYRRQQFNYLSQQDPRGTFTFTGAATGSDFADFLLGVPDASSIAFGNADKYLRAAVTDAYVTDDWRIGPGVSLNAGVRWEYSAPFSEKYGRLVNLDVAPGFTSVAPVTAGTATGPLTGRHYPAPLIGSDHRALEPRVGVAWHPDPASSLVIRAGYGLYFNTSFYQSIALQMAQQPPISTSFSVQNTTAHPLSLANGFLAPVAAVTNTFAADPDLRVGSAHNWNVSVQRDFLEGNVMTVSYLGIKGTHAPQQFLPNTYPNGAANPCPACPAGFIYLTSNGNSTRHAGIVQVRRRLHAGLAATLQYTYSKSIDDALTNSALPTGSLIAQNWLDPGAERGLSVFDQRHLASVQAQYTSGMGLSGGTLMDGWRGRLLKDWTLSTQLSLGSGLPLTPVYTTLVQGTGVSGTIRPDYTGVSVYDAPSGLFLNPAAYTAPRPGRWGNAGRNSITGPSQFALSLSLGRTFRVSERASADLRFDSTNPLNHVTFPGWNTNVSSLQFGLPSTANPMRSLQTTLRVRF